MSARSVWPFIDPEEDDDDELVVVEICEYESEPEDLMPCEYSASRAEDRWTTERDRTASQ